jgi:hypothetical protein
MSASPVEIKRKKLGKKVDGLYHPPGSLCDGSLPRIDIDIRLTNEEELDTLVHECIHHTLPYLNEETVIAAGTMIAAILWSDGWRKTDDNATGL